MKLTLIALSLAATLAAHPAAAADLKRDFATVPRAAWAEADPADSLYRSARRALTDKDYEMAARLFDAIVSRYPRSEYAADAFYWKGFALYRDGKLDDAASALEAQAKRYPSANTRGDAAALLIQIKGQLAQRGDASAQADVDRAASQTVKSCGDMELQMAALDAVQQMDAERVLPLLKRVLARRDECSKRLRKNALFILAQKSGGERERILLDIAKTDPDPSVKNDAVFYLQQARSDAAIDALEDLLLRGDDRAVRKNALFALAQNRAERARKILTTLALSDGAPADLRKDAIFYLAQGSEGTSGAELAALYDRLSGPLKKDVIFFIAQRHDPASLDKLIAIAKSDPAPELRKEALFHVGQSKDPKALKALEEIVNP